MPPSSPRHSIRFGLALIVGLAGLFVALALVLRPLLGRLGMLMVVGPVLIAVGAWALLRYGGATWASLGLKREGWGRGVVEGLLGTVAVSGWLVLTIFAFFGVEGLETTWRAITGFSAGARLSFVAVGLMAAVMEEPLFRGYLQPALMRRLGFAGGLAATVLLFAVVHVRALSVPSAFLGKVGVGLGLGLLRGRDRPLYAAMVAHGVLWVVWGTA